MITTTKNGYFKTNDGIINKFKVIDIDPVEFAKITEKYTKEQIQQAWENLEEETMGNIEDVDTVLLNMFFEGE